ncbi:MAG: hypothetical protein EB038_10490 [Cyclobacteriaceae bacterium]|nr:hypothetical protein [Cyclobacteriaceae bacterium]
MVGTRAINFLANFAGPSYAVPIALGQILKLAPGNDKVIKNAIDSTFGKLPGYSYEELFPYGIESDLGRAATQAFTPAYLRNFLVWVKGDESKKEWVDSFTSEWNYQMALYEMGIGKQPTEELVAKNARKNLAEKFPEDDFSNLYKMFEDDPMMSLSNNLHDIRNELWTKSRSPLRLGRFLNRLFPGKFTPVQIEEFTNNFKAAQEKQAEINQLKGQHNHVKIG